MIDSHIHLSCKCYNQTFPYIDYDGKELTIAADGRRETVIATPIEYLLLETDGPYVKPERPDDVTGKKWEGTKYEFDSSEYCGKDCGIEMHDGERCRKDY